MHSLTLSRTLMAMMLPPPLLSLRRSPCCCHAQVTTLTHARAHSLTLSRMLLPLSRALSLLSSGHAHSIFLHAAAHALTHSLHCRPASPQTPRHSHTGAVAMRLPCLCHAVAVACRTLATARAVLLPSCHAHATLTLALILPRQPPACSSPVALFDYRPMLQSPGNAFRDALLPRQEM